MKTILIGNDISFRWDVREKGGSPFDLEGKEVALYRKGFSGNVRIGEVSVKGNVVSWSWPGRDQKSPGTYSFLLVVNEGGDGMHSLDTGPAVTLVSSSGERCRVGFPDKEDLEGILNDYLQAVDKANEAAGEAIRAANKAIKAISSMESALDSIKKLLSSGSVYIGVLESGGKIPEADSNIFMLCGPGEYSVDGSPVKVGIGQLGILSNASGQWEMDMVQVVDVLQEIDSDSAQTSPNPASVSATMKFLDFYLKPGNLASIIPGWGGFFSKIDDISTITGPLDFSETNYLTEEENLKDACVQLDEEVKAANDNIAILGAEAGNLAKSKQDKLAAGTGIAIQGNVISCTLDTSVFVVKESLPEQPDPGKGDKIYVVPNPDGQGNDIYDEYAWLNGKWEKLGSFKASVDLSAYQTKEDDSLETESKTVAGAINELQEKQRVLPPTSGKADEFLEGSSDGRPVWTSAYDVVRKILTRNNMSPLNAGNNLDNILTPGLYYSSANSNDIINSPFPGKPFILCVIETGSIQEFVQIVLTSYAESNIYVRSCYNMANWQPWQQIVTSTNVSDSAMRPVYEACGAVWNEETGYYELNGLTDITEEEMMWIYIETFGWWKSADGPICRYCRKARTNIRPMTYGVQFNERAIFPFSEGIFETLNFDMYPNLTGNIYPINIFNNVRVLNTCRKLTVVTGVFQLYKYNNSDFEVCSVCPLLREIRLRVSNNSGSFCKDSPLLSYESVKYLVDNAANTAAITVTVNPTTYSYLAGAAQPAAEVGGTTEEWQALMTTAASKQISFATEE